MKYCAARHNIFVKCKNNVCVYRTPVASSAGVDDESVGPATSAAVKFERRRIGDTRIGISSSIIKTGRSYLNVVTFALSLRLLGLIVTTLPDTLTKPDPTAIVSACCATCLK